MHVIGDHCVWRGAAVAASEPESDGMHFSGVIFYDLKPKNRCRCSLNRKKQYSMRKGSGLDGGILKGFIPHVIDNGHVGLIRYISAGSANHSADRERRLQHPSPHFHRFHLR